MNRILMTFAAGLLAAGCAAAQEDHFAFAVNSDHGVAPQVRVMSLQSGVMGKPVKGAPYSGTEINETTQMLADGTRIHNEVQTQVYRDSEGRMRRESGSEITIWDPVANTSWVLNPKTQTARKLPIGVYYFNTKVGEGSVVIRTMAAGAPDKVLTEDIKGRNDELRAKMKAELDSKVREAVRTETMSYSVTHSKAPAESLGKRMIEGVNAEGTKTVNTIEPGTIGNDRAIQSVSERWFSPDLQTVMLTRHSDPRTGEEVFKLVNVNRSEPAPYLFQVPAGYQIVEQK
jgi:hypothetical protein